MITETLLEELSIYLPYMLTFIINVMIFIFSIRDFGHPKCLKSHFGHPIMEILAKFLLIRELHSVTNWPHCVTSIS